MLESGAKDYKYYKAEIEVGFPVDFKDVEYCTCSYCPYFSPYSSECHLTRERVIKPENYVGFKCPFLKTMKEDNNV